ncbi:Serine/threonine protein kinase [Burkholderiales bacterium]|nr:Serine/threonine protein kinase [Burkholderiales bacterium]
MVESTIKPNAKGQKRPPAPEHLGKYPLLGVVGKGAMGVVYKSFDPDIRRPVALKTIRRDLLDDDGAEKFSARFRNEAQAAGGLLHPGIVAVYEYGEEDEYAYIAMEYVEGSSLKQYFEQKIRFGIADVISIMSQLLEALLYAHERGVWHRDIKPANILIMSNGRVKVTDFGIARIESSTLTQIGAIMGTPGYIAPELYLSQECDCRIDVFAAGVVLYQLLTKVPPYGGTAENVMFKVCYETPVPPSVAAGDPYLERFDAIVLRALAKSPDDRFASAAHFREALMQAHAHPVSPTVSEETIICNPPMVPAGRETHDPSSAASSARSAAPTASSSASKGSAAPTASTATLIAAGWDMEELARIEKHLARFLGPVAKVMVRRAASEAKDLASLVHWLAARLTSSAEQAEFLKRTTTIRLSGTLPPARSATDEATVVAQRAGAPPPARVLTPEEIARAMQLLAIRLGPIARVLVKRAAQPGVNRDQFLASLLVHLGDSAERERFLDELG